MHWQLHYNECIEYLFFGEKVRKCKRPYSILLKKHKLTKIIDLAGIEDGIANCVVVLKAARGSRSDRSNLEQNSSKI